MDEIFSDADVLSLSGMEALDWFQSVEEKRRPVPVDFDWACLAKGAALRARITDEEESLAWASVATATFQNMAKKNPTLNHDVGEMYCRAAMIERHGAQAQQDGLLDPDVIYGWFRQSSMSIDATLALIGRLMDEISDDFVTDVVEPLRFIKQRLSVVRALPNECEIPADIAEFSKLYHQLP